MLSLFIVLSVIMGAVRILNYQEIVVDVDAILSILVENDGNFPHICVDSHRGVFGGLIGRFSFDAFPIGRIVKHADAEILKIDFGENSDGGGGIPGPND